MAGLIIGGALLLAGIASVLFVDFAPLPPAPPEVIRPVKVAIASDLLSRPERQLRGEVLAGRTVDLAFQVAGPLIEADLTLGRRVKKGDVLARIDPVRYEQQVATLEPQLRQAEDTLARVKQLAAGNAATVTELDQAQATRDTIFAQLNIARQAIADTTLRAPFDALIVARFAENFQYVTAGTPAARLQDISTLDIAVDLPEAIVALYRPSDPPTDLRVRFAVRPQTTYPVTLKEASADADPHTGTYRAVFSMPAPQEVTLLAGMSATLIIPARTGGDGKRVWIPMVGLSVNETGEKTVWRIDTDAQGARVVRTPVNVVELAGEGAIIEGVAPGTSIVTAGTAFLRDGQRVNPMEPRR